ncbi:MAG: hypothetical protein ORN98_02590 [Alphaproteobacteria bacterium]|nr:hypothetical protein [Alphaproteobacteria bacterium]
MRRDSVFTPSSALVDGPLSAPQSDNWTAAAPPSLPTQWGKTGKFQRYVTPAAMVYAKLHREPEPDWWGERIAENQAAFFDQSCAETASIFTGRLVAGDKFSRLWFYFVPEQGLASALALRRAIREDYSLDRMGMKIRISVALGESNALTDPNLTDHEWTEGDYDGRSDSDSTTEYTTEFITDSGMSAHSWNSGSFGIETATRKAFRLCRVARMGEVLVSHDFLEYLTETDYYCVEQRIAGLDDESPRALVIESKMDRAFPADNLNRGNLYHPKRDVRKNPTTARHAA